jgi:hypothetical protein
MEAKSCEVGLSEWDLSFVLTLNAECDVHLDTLRTPVLDGFFFCSKTPGKGHSGMR